LGSCWTVRAVIAAAKLSGPRTCIRSLYHPRVLNGGPAEQIFRHLRKHLSNTVFTTLDELQNALIDELQQFWEHPTVLLRLTAYPWWVEAIESNISSTS
jgi:hypothetical protein